MKRFLLVLFVVIFTLSIILLGAGCKEKTESSKQEISKTETTEVKNTSSEVAANKIVFMSHRDLDYEIYIMYLDGSMETKLTSSPGVDLYPSFSPDGSKIVFESIQDGYSEIYIINPDGSEQTRLTNSPGWDSAPCFSPDGSKIVFTSERDGNKEIYIMNIDGSEQVNLTNNSANDEHPSLSPDGSKIVFESYRDENNEICIMNIDGSEQVILTHDMADDLYPSFSPDGSKIVFESSRNRRSYAIYSMNIDGSKQVELTNSRVDSRHPAYSPVIDLTRAGATKLEITILETDEMENISSEDLNDYYLSMEMSEFGVFNTFLYISKSGFIEYATIDLGYLYDHKIGKLSEESMEKLSELIENSGFFNLEDVYYCPENLCVEGTITISVFRDGEVKSVHELGIDAPYSFYGLVDYLQEQIIARLQDDPRYGTFIKVEKGGSSTSENIISEEELEAHPLLAKAIDNPGWFIYTDTLTNAGLDDYIAYDEYYFSLNFEDNKFFIEVYERQK